MGIANRRAFLEKIVALTALSSGAKGASAARRPADATPVTRAQAALQIRQNAAVFECAQTAGSQVTNGDESALPAYIGNFTKGLAHTQLGEVLPGAYETLQHAIATGSQADFEALARGSDSKFVNPMAGYAFQMEGADSHRLGMDTPPALSSANAAAEMVELYWQALARDVPFTNYASSPVTQSAAADLNQLSGFRGPGAGGAVTTANLFRGPMTGALTGPYVSQFFWQPVPMNSTPVPQKYRSGAAGVDYLTSWDEWLAVQNGNAPFHAWSADPQLRYIYDGRSLAEWVHFDFLYQAYHNAALILLNQSPETVLTDSPYFNPTNPYKSAKVESGFATFGAAHICCLLGTMCQTALLAAWYQKWMVHRRARPEEFGGRVHQNQLGLTNYPIHGDLMNSAAMKAVHAANGTYLLPQAFPEGAPMHPAYPSGHATVAGACSVVLKAFFDENQILTNCVVASSDGLSLGPYNDSALTVGGEVNKLAFNVAMGRNFAGIHYRSDAEAGMRLGEDVAIAMLQDAMNNYAEDFNGFQFTRVDGTSVVISRSA